MTLSGEEMEDFQRTMDFGGNESNWVEHQSSYTVTNRRSSQTLTQYSRLRASIRGRGLPSRQYTHERPEKGATKAISAGACTDRKVLIVQGLKQPTHAQGCEAKS